MDSPYASVQGFPFLYVVRLLAYTAFLTVLPLVFFYSRPSLPSKAPKLIRESYPIVGAIRFFTARWDFFHDAMRQSHTGNFSFYIGKHPVIGLSGDLARSVFFGSTQLAFAEGYAVLFGQSPTVTDKGTDVAGTSDFSAHFNKRIIHMLRREYLSKSLPHLIGDTQARLEELAASPSGITDPFRSIYEIVFQLTMRMVGCDEIANDPALLEKTLHLFETIEASSTATTIIFPWFPSIALIKRTIAGGKLYMIFKKVMDGRLESGKREDDALQYLIDLGDSTKEIIAFVVGALFAGQLNSGINAAFVLAYLGQDPYWMAKVREEVEFVLKKYSTDRDAPLWTQLQYVPLDAWESEFASTDLCLRDSIRLNTLGSAFRRNLSGGDVKVGDEVIPNGAFVAYHMADIHNNPSFYSDPSKWDPGRYLANRAEDKKSQYAYLGWGAGRHPCLGMRFAKLEQNIIVAAFVSKFDYEVCSQNGKQLETQPRLDINGHSAGKPKEPIYLKYQARK